MNDVESSDSPDALGRHTDFICVCKEDGQKEADRLMADVLARLECEPDKLLTSVAVSLNWDYRAHITGIGNDMWSGVAVETYAKGDDDKPEFSVWVQCDLVEHGIARAWQMFADRKVEE